jgi:hypothetical protein
MKKETEISAAVSRTTKKLVVTRKSGQAILKQLKTGRPTKALRDLMRDGE